MKTEKTIIIIGNGFDIAHGLKTKYSDFAKHILNKISHLIFTNLDNETELKNEGGFLSIDFINYFNNTVLNKATYNGSINSQRFVYFHNLIKEESLSQEHVYACLSKENSFLKNISNELLTELFSDFSHKSWFDIEKGYYNLLVEYKNKFSSALDDSLKSRVLDGLIKLNETFDIIKKELFNYLKEEIKPSYIERINNQLRHIIEDENNNNTIEQFYFVNFNYTNTLFKYIKLLSRYKCKVNHIHGAIDLNNIVLGFGNDLDKNYNEIKDLENENFFKHLKTLDYLMDENYIDFYNECIHSCQKFNVHVIGHSLGSADKTLIGELFNSENCNKVFTYKIFDFDEKDREKEHRNIYINALRIFNNDNLARVKLVDYKKIKLF
jgi:uncharacterized protein (DUF2267 family)